MQAEDPELGCREIRPVYCQMPSL